MERHPVEELRESALQFLVDEYVEARIRAEELAAVPGQVECDWRHELDEPDGQVVREGRSCPGCGAAV